MSRIRQRWGERPFNKCLTAAPTGYKHACWVHWIQTWFPGNKLSAIFFRRMCILVVWPHWANLLRKRPSIRIPTFPTTLLTSLSKCLLTLRLPFRVFPACALCHINLVVCPNQLYTSVRGVDKILYLASWYLVCCSVGRGLFNLQLSAILRPALTL